MSPHELLAKKQSTLEIFFTESKHLVPVSSTRKTSAIWKFRIVFSSIIILLLVVGTFFFLYMYHYIFLRYDINLIYLATVVISELTKKEGS